MQRLFAATLTALVLSACGPDEDGVLQGYVEGETLRIAAPVGGTLSTLSVQRGDAALAGTPLFELESLREAQELAEAEARILTAEATLADLRKGKRSEELAVVQAQLAQARAAAALSESQLARARELHTRKLAPPESLDEALSRHRQNLQRIQELIAQLDTARLPARADAIARAEAELQATQARAEQVRWQLTQKRQAAPEAGLVQDTLFRPGEYVPAGQPVVNVLPPSRIKLRFFVPETRLAQIKTGQTLSASCDGCGAPFPATVRFISPQAEFTPPVIYSRENRAKFVYLVEAWPKPEQAAKLHPGQPVDIRLGVKP